jgi:general transcription factor IIIA
MRREEWYDIARMSHALWSVFHHILNVCSFSRCVDSTALERHMRTVHSSERPFACNIEGCDFRTSHQSSLNDHISNHEFQLNGQYLFVCNVYQCSYKNNKQSNMVRHHRAKHMGERPFVCPSCGQRFSLKWNMNLHFRSFH